MCTTQRIMLTATECNSLGHAHSRSLYNDEQLLRHYLLTSIGQGAFFFFYQQCGNVKVGVWLNSDVIAACVASSNDGLEGVLQLGEA